MSHAVVGSNSRVFSYRKVCITDEDTNAEEAFEFISTCSRVRRDDGRNVVGPWSSMRQYVHSRCKQFYTTRRGHYKSWSRHMASMERKGSVVLEVRESRQVLGKRGERQRERERESSPLQGDPALLFGPRFVRARFSFGARTRRKIVAESRPSGN